MSSIKNLMGLPCTHDFTGLYEVAYKLDHHVYNLYSDICKLIGVPNGFLLNAESIAKSTEIIMD